MKDISELNPDEFHASDVPTSGSFRRGDRIWNTEPSETSPVGWICIQSGDFDDPENPDPAFKAFGE